MRSLVRSSTRLLFKGAVGVFWRHPALTRKMLASPRGRQAIASILAWLATRPPRFDQALFSVMRWANGCDFLALAKASTGDGRSPGALAARVHFLSLAHQLEQVALELARADVDPDDLLLTPARIEALRTGHIESAVAEDVLIDELEPPPWRRGLVVSIVAAPVDVVIGAAAKVLLWQPSIARVAVRSSFGHHVVAAVMASRARKPAQFNWMYYALIRYATPDDCSAIADCAERLGRLREGYGLRVARLYFLNRAQRYRDALTLLSSQRHVLRDDPLVTPARIDALFHEDRRLDVVDAITRTRVEPSNLSRHGSYQLAGVAAACEKKTDLVFDCFAHQVCLEPRREAGKRTAFDAADVWREIADRTLAALSPLDRYDLPSAGRVGFVYHNMPHSLGHSLHEPYFFLSMYRHQYDRIYLVGGDLRSYQPGPRACMDIVNQYCRYVTAHDGFFHHLAHFPLGQHRHGALGFHALDNWALMREATLRTRDPADPFRLGDWRMSLPERFVELGRAFCRSWGIDLARPIVAFHVRSHASLQIHRQALRNAVISDYVPAIQWLIDGGYQVIRLGDTRMPRLELPSRHYHELPFMAGYTPELDAFFVANARFMLTSPSGPVAHALALGTPFVVANSILNYLHVSPGPEMHCLKVYVDTRTGRELSMEEAIQRRLFHKMHEPELTQAGYTVRDATAEEILASVHDMVEWVANPNLPLTGRQTRFAQAADTMAAELASDQHLTPAIADFIGFSLPTFRIAPSVAESRNDFPETRV